MDQLQIEDFFPYYLQYDETTNLYPEPYNTLYNNILVKREFNINQLPAIEDPVSISNKGKARLHQEFMAKFMSPLTPYDRMLVFHEVGTGKCVLPGTQVYLNNKLISIEEFWTGWKTINPQIGLEQWLELSNSTTKSYANGKYVQSNILRAFRQYVDEDICVYKTSSCVLKCTKKHKLLINGSWLDYNDIKVGDSVRILRNFGSALLDVTQGIIDISIEKYCGFVYDLEVENVHNYVANQFVTHNTCLLANVVELARSQISTGSTKFMNKPLILVRGPTIKKNIIKEIANKCFPDKYRVAKIDIKTKKVLSQETIDRRTTKKVNQNYQLETFFTFAKQLKGLTTVDMQKLYSNRYIFVDEAHRLREQDDEAKAERVEVYKELYRFFHAVQNCKILLMTATPMKDKPTEICQIMNLLLPYNNQMLENELFDANGAIKNNKILSNYFRNIVSFVRQEGGKLNVTFEGDVALNMREMKTVRLPMLSTQNNQYKSDYDLERVDKENIEAELSVLDPSSQEEEEEPTLTEISGEEKTKVKSTLYKKSKNDSLFVFPTDVKTNLVKSGNNYSLNSELYKFLKKDTIEETLLNLEQYSIKYRYIIDYCLNNQQKIFVFNNIVSNSGSLLLGSLFNLVNYQPLDFPSDTDINIYISKLKPAKRYAVLTGKISDSYISKIVDFFNHPLNIDGKYLQVIIGSSKISEGLSFKEVRQCFIVTPFWNNTETEQAIGRVIRLDSHDRLPPDQRTVIISRLAAIPEYSKDEITNINNSIDMIMYKRSEDKDIQIKSVERLLKASAVDCVLNRERNTRPSDIDGSRECDYKNCDYKCNFVSVNSIADISPKDYIYDTYNLYYAEEIIAKIQAIVYELFKYKSSYDFEEMYTHFKALNIQPILLLRALKDIIYKNVPIINRVGFVNFLKEDRNLYFLVDDPRVPSIFTYFYYADKPVPTVDVDFNEYIKILNYNTLEDRLKLLNDKFDDFTEAQVLAVISTFDKTILDTLLRQFFLSSENSSFKFWFMNRYGDYIIKIKKYRVDYFIYNITKDPNDLFYIKSPVVSEDPEVQKQMWNNWKQANTEQDIDMKVKTLFEDYKINSIQYLTIDNPFGYYAKIDEQNRFKITKIIKEEDLPRTKKGEISKRAIPRGLECGTGELKKPNVLFFFMLFGAIADHIGSIKPYPILNKIQKQKHEELLGKIDTIEELQQLLRASLVDWDNTFGDETFEKLVSVHNSTSDIKINYDVNTIDDKEELIRMLMLLKNNEVKGIDSNLCAGLKKWFSDVGYMTRFV